MSNDPFDLLVSGYVSMDRIIKINSPARVGYTSLITNRDNAKINYGGCPINICAALNKLGKRAVPVIRVGDDYEEIGFRDFLIQSGIPLDGVELVPNEKTSCCYLVENPQGEHITLFYTGAMDAKYSRPVPDELIKRKKMALITVGAKPDNEYFLEKVQKYSVPLVFSMKSDPDAFPKELLSEILKESLIIFMNESERKSIEALFGFGSITDLFSFGKAQILVTTCGAAGSRYFWSNNGNIRSEMIPACRPDQVVDTTGSGDAYLAGFMVGYLDRRSILDCCRYGSVLASFIIEKEGCCTNIPTMQQFMDRYNRFIREQEDRK